MQELNRVHVIIKQKQNCTNWQRMCILIIKKEGDMCRTKVKKPSNYTSTAVKCSADRKPPKSTEFSSLFSALS